LRPEAERTLAAATEASDVMRRARTLAGGTASLGTFSTAEHLLLPGLVEDFAQRHPEVAIRVVGQNSSELADAVRAGRLEAGLVALPIDDEGLDVSPAMAQFEVVLVLPEARWGDEDPTRRQLAERAQRAGIAIRPHIEVQHAYAALELAARGLADTLVTRALVDGLGFGDRLTGVSLDPPLYEAFAFISRRNVRVSPATRALMALAERHLARAEISWM
jgi:DNA-binding transcriptional LysR family regulator